MRENQRGGKGWGGGREKREGWGREEGRDGGSKRGKKKERGAMKEYDGVQADE